MKKKTKIVLAGIAAILLVLVIGCGVYVSDYYHADAAAVAAMGGSNAVTVQEADDMAVFVPEEPMAGFIFYPGGKLRS